MNRRQRKKHNVSRRGPLWRTFESGRAVLRACGHPEWVYVRQRVSWVVLKQAAFDVHAEIGRELERELTRVCSIPAKCCRCSRGGGVL